MSTGIKAVQDDFAKSMEKMLSKAQNVSAGMARLYPMYQKFQLQRFMTENKSEGDQWAPLSPLYSERKRKRYAKFPGAGQRMMIATSTLAGAVIGPGAPFDGTDRHRFLTTSTGMTIAVEQGGVNGDGRPFNYADRVAEVRPFMTFSETSIDAMKAELRKFILGD